MLRDQGGSSSVSCMALRAASRLSVQRCLSSGTCSHMLSTNSAGSAEAFTFSSILSIRFYLQCCPGYILDVELGGEY